MTGSSPRDPQQKGDRRKAVPLPPAGLGVGEVSGRKRPSRLFAAIDRLRGHGRQER